MQQSREVRENDHTERKIETFCKDNARAFSREMSDYLGRYLLGSTQTLIGSVLLFSAGLIMAVKTGHVHFTFSHVLSASSALLYRTVSHRLGILNSDAIKFCNVVNIIITVEGMATFYMYHKFGQINLMAGAAATISLAVIWILNFEPRRSLRIAISTSLSVMLCSIILWLEPAYFMINAGGMAVGIALGISFHGLIYKIFRYKFYFSYQEQNLKSHAYLQLEKVLYPHQRHMIESGRILEDTMPTGSGSACIIAFDVVESTKLKSPYAKILLLNVLKKCQSKMMENYSMTRMEANAYRIKEMGDGFLCSIGFPFSCPSGMRKESLAISLSECFVEIFAEESEMLFPGEKLYCSIGISSGVIEGFYPHTSPKGYDVYGLAVNLAVRYESMRKELFKIFGKSNIIVIQKSVFQGLNDIEKNAYVRYAFSEGGIRDDDSARELYFKRIESPTLIMSSSY